MNSILGMPVPPHWRTSLLKHLTVSVNRGTAPDYVDDGPVRMISQASNQLVGLDWSKTRFHNFSGDPSTLKGFLEPGDVLVNSTGTGTLGRVGQYFQSVDDRPNVADGHVTVVRPAGNDLDPRYCFYWLSSRPFQEYIYAALVVGATNQIELNRDRLRDAPVPLPPIAEQRRIADFLDTETLRIDKLRRLRLKQRELTTERTNRHISWLAVGGAETTVQTGNSWIPQIPPGWEVLPLKRRWRIIDCKHRTPTYAPSGYPVISPGDISPGRISLAGAHRFVGEDDYRDLADEVRRPRRGDIVYSRNASVGIAAYVDTDSPFTMGQDVCRITSDSENQLFLMYVLNTIALSELRSLQIGSTFARINIGTLLELSIPCPPRGEQSQISRQMDRVNSAGSSFLRQINRQLDLLAERRQALITAAVTGQFDVTTASGRNVTEGVTV